MTDTAIHPSSPTISQTISQTSGQTSGQTITALPDARPAFAKAVALGRTVLAGITIDQLGAPTPCPDYDVRALTGHLVAVLHRVAIIGAGGDPTLAPREIAGVADDRWVEAYDQYAAAAAAVWSNDAVLTDIVTVPWTKLPGAIALMIYTSEVTVHTWDMAVATGQDPTWDDEVVGLGLAAMQRGLPDEGRIASFGIVEGQAPAIVAPFLDVVPVGSDARLIDQLVAWCGRNPAV